MIVVTGGAGFIGSVLIEKLNQAGTSDILVVDNISTTSKWKNLIKRQFNKIVHKNQFLEWLKSNGSSSEIEGIFHLGACSATSEKDVDYLLENNVNYSIELFNFCTKRQIPFIYASSAATYGNGERGYCDKNDELNLLRPINPYGYSKHLFDLWVDKQDQAPPFWQGLKFFNVFGPNEYHKDHMRSLVCKAVPQIQKSRSLSLFESYREDIAHGEQKRDFIYIDDVVKVMLHFWRSAVGRKKHVKNGIYNVGTGEARSFKDLGRAVFATLNTPEQFEWIPMPKSIQNGYQYFTEANLERLRNEGGYLDDFLPLEKAIDMYVNRFLIQGDPYL